jgi:peptidoglycan/xylan/chitin deacetylase (PgdA/CDA1 family)
MIVLNYHLLTDAAGRDAWTLTPAEFDEHLAVLGPHLKQPDWFLQHAKDPALRRDPSVLLTVDDGFLSDYDLLYSQLMAQGRIPGFMSFLPMAFIGRDGRLTWDMVCEMDRNGVLIGSHGLNHLDLTKCPDHELDDELQTSKAVLEQHLSRPVTHFAFPYGRFTKRVWDRALKAGYTHLFTIQLGHHQGFEDFLYSRLCVRSEMDAAYMRRHIANPDQARGPLWKLSSAVGLYRPLVRLRHGLLSGRQDRRLPR